MAERDVQARVFALGAEVGARAFVVQLGRTTAWEFYTPVEAGMKKGGTLISAPWVPFVAYGRCNAEETRRLPPPGSRAVIN
jgi:hypothetical protein